MMGAAVIVSGFMLGARLGWKSDWVRRLFRLGPYRKPKPATYFRKD